MVRSRVSERMPSLISEFAGLVCDLDGVVYKGPGAIEHAVEALNGSTDAGIPVMYATNNAARPAATVAEHLTELGLRTDADHVVTSAQAGAQLLAEHIPAGSVVLCVGGPGVALAASEAGLEPVTPQQRIDDPTVAERIVAVLQGYGLELTWSDLQEAAYAVRAGATWMATNTDLTIPTARGIAPGNGSAVAAVRNAAGVAPMVAGKPHPPLYVTCAQRLGVAPKRMLAIGDRLDTDIEGAHASGTPSLLVLTGVDGVVEAAGGPDVHRPTYVGLDLRTLHEPYAAAARDQDGWTCGDAHATLAAGDLTVTGDGVHAVRAALAAVWAAIDDGALDRALTDSIRDTLRGLDPRSQGGTR